MNKFNQNFENYNSFNGYITKIEKLEYGEMLNTDMQIFEINNSNINSEENIKIKDSIVEVEDTSSKTSTRYSADTSTSSIQEHLYRYGLLKKKKYKSHSEKEQIEQLILLIKWIIQIDEPSFRELLNKLDPLFKIPKQQSIQNKILNTFIKQRYKLNIIIRSYMGTAICNFIMLILNEFNLTQKAATITSDNKANVVKAYHLIKAKLDSDEFMHYRCICHILNLVVGKDLKRFHLVDKKEFLRPILDIKTH
ncbi:16738_t:CDS:2 [Dentiscutata erythropus]|uniref:16738_t:CDS:1 n=1 Tax=Dentiscutata erythropus TaxID=1348616 RepID=A0A9N9BSW2_9GLOM|nr:16738_t:CDS:2 [Dentiscutata erythropus]